MGLNDVERNFTPVGDRQRNALSESVSRKLARDESGSYQDAESDLENELLDLEGNNKKPEADK